MIKNREISFSDIPVAAQIRKLKNEKWEMGSRPMLRVNDKNGNGLGKIKLPAHAARALRARV